MKKTIRILFSTFLTFSCTDFKAGKNTVAEMEKLQAENDGLSSSLE
jgi:hypothetical protein